MKSNLPKNLDCEVLIVGAGAAGLACAQKLRAAGVSCLIIEARNRIGGRIYTQSSHDDPIELGAEFIHGAHKEVLELLEEFKLPFEDLYDYHLYKKQKKFVEIPSFWEQIDKVNGLLKANLKKDRSIADFLHAHKNVISPSLRNLYVSYIEGFQAADLNLAGEKDLARGNQDEEPTLNSQSQFRPLSGYLPVLKALEKKASVKRSPVILNSCLKKVFAQKHHVESQVQHSRHKRNKIYRSHFLVLTLPVDVLRNSIVFEEPLDDLQKSLQYIHMGHVQKIIFEFKDRFWEHLSEKPVGFLHSRAEENFPTWWTQMPRRNNCLTAWQGGPKAYEMSFLSEKERVYIALKSLSRLTGKKLSFLHDVYVRHFTHNWSQDPWSLGAYSYVGIQSKRLQVKPSQVFNGNIVLAGEAITHGSDRGTVTGALKSGHEAATRILELL